MKDLEEVEKPTRKAKSKPEMPKGARFVYKEISVPLTSIQTREALDKLYKGNVSKTCLKTAWSLAEKELKKYA